MLTIDERRELSETKRHVHDVVTLLNVCSCCDNVSECKPDPYEYGAWLCQHCTAEMAHSNVLAYLAERRLLSGRRAVPSPRA